MDPFEGEGALHMKLITHLKINSSYKLLHIQISSVYA